MNDDLDKKLKININKDLLITTRTSNCLLDQGIRTIGDLINYKEKQLLTFPKLGLTGLAEIKAVLYDLDLKLGTDEIYIDKTLEQVDVKKDIILDDNLNIDMLKDWPLSVRTQNCLRELKIRFVGDLVPYSRGELLRSNNFGKKSLEELSAFFNKYSLTFDDDVDASWDDVREKLVKEDKLFYKKEINLEHSLQNSDEQKSHYTISRSILENPKIIQDTILEEKIIISEEASNFKIEEIIIEDIKYILSLLNNKHRDIFKGRYGYISEYKTLDELGKIYKVTRERVRQLEKQINKSLYALGRVNKKLLIKYFNKNEYISFHKIFPELDKNFSNEVRNKSNIDITRDGLTNFLENYCGVNNNFFKTPERELVNFDKFKLREIFLSTISGESKDNFIEIIQANYGYNKFIAKSAMDYMARQNLIKIIDEKVFPVYLTKNLEVAHILLNYPDGLHWAKICKLGNNSYTDNNWDTERIMADSSLAMTSNELIYLSEKGCHKLVKFCKELKNKEKIIAIFIKTLKDLNFEQSDMEHIYKKVTNINEFENLNFYDARAIIKIFGSESGIFHYGKSGTNTIGFKEDLKIVGLKEKITNIIMDNDGPISLSEINKKLQKTKEELPLSIHLDELVDEMVIFRIDPATFLKFEDAINLCNKNNVKEALEKLLVNYEFITYGFIREKINNELDYNLSNFYYDSLSRILARENSWFYDKNYLSKNNKKTMLINKYILNLYDKNISINENYEIISKHIGISRSYYDTIANKKTFNEINY